MLADSFVLSGLQCLHLDGMSGCQCWLDELFELRVFETSASCFLSGARPVLPMGVAPECLVE